MGLSQSKNHGVQDLASVSTDLFAARRLDMESFNKAPAAFTMLEESKQISKATRRHVDVRLVANKKLKHHSQWPGFLQTLVHQNTEFISHQVMATNVIGPALLTKVAQQPVGPGLSFLWPHGRRMT